MIKIPDEFAAPLFPNLSEGFILDEDRALHRYLRYPPLSVYDQTGDPREVGVWFGHPDREVREQRYPYMLISLVDITEASDRVMSGPRIWQTSGVPIDLLPDDVVVGEDGLLYNGGGIWNDVWYDKSSYPILCVADNPIPVQLDYVVRAYSRHPRHDRQIMGGFLSRKMNYRYSYLPMGNIDGTNRRMQLLNTAHAETMEMGKRLFLSTFTVRIDGWMPASHIQVVEGAHVLKVLGKLTYRDIRGITVAEEFWVNERPRSTPDKEKK